MGIEVEERVVASVVTSPPPDVGWFLARQPGIVRYLEARCGEGSDTLGVALHCAALMHAAYEVSLGVPPRRVPSQLLERAEAAVVSECDAPVSPGFVARQPALAQWVAGVVSSPPVPLREDEVSCLGLSLAAVIYALDEVAAGS